MKLYIRIGVLGVTLCAILAAQAGLSAIGVKESDVLLHAKTYLLGSDNPDLPFFFAVGGQMRTAWKSKGPAERTQEIRELVTYAKQFVAAPMFQQTYNEWIKTQYSAVDHGLKPQSQAAAMAQISSPGSIGSIMANSMKSMPPQILKTMFDADMNNWKGDEEQAKFYKRAQQIAPLFSSNPEEFKQQYILLKSESLGGPSSEAGLAAGAQSMGDMKTRGEQSNYDQYNLKAMLKRRLQNFITLARSVDFSAQTQPRGNVQVFVNPDYERKPPAWKELYRLGKEPTQAATAAAEQWLREL